MSSNIASSRYMLVISDLIEKSSAIVYNERSSEVVDPTLTNACPTLVTMLRQPSSDPMAATIKARPVITLRHRLFHPSLSTHAPSSASVAIYRDIKCRTTFANHRNHFNNLPLT